MVDLFTGTAWALCLATSLARAELGHVVSFDLSFRLIRADFSVAYSGTRRARQRTRRPSSMKL